MNGLIKVRIRETGQVLEMMANAAYPRLEAGTAELFVEDSREVAAGLRGVIQKAAKFLNPTRG